MRNEDAMGMLESALYCIVLYQDWIYLGPNIKYKALCEVDEIRFDIFGNIITLFPSAF